MQKAVPTAAPPKALLSAVIGLIVVLLAGCQPSPHHSETDPALREALHQGLEACLVTIKDLPDSPSIRRRQAFQIERLAKHLMNDHAAMQRWPSPGLDAKATQVAAHTIIESQASRGRDIAPPQRW